MANTTYPRVLVESNNLPIKTELPVHHGKVRSVYWLSAADSSRLIKDRKYNVAPGSTLAIMVISDRISAFECIWRGEGGMGGVPGKGAALNAISSHWFKLFREKGLAESHILEVPHPLVWVVQKVQPVMIEAIARQYITGSMWRAYSKGEREFCGIKLPEGLKKDSKLPELLITPSTKGIIKGVPNVPEHDDVNISRKDIDLNFKAFQFRTKEDVSLYERLLAQGFSVISNALSHIDQIFVDTKFEFGYAQDSTGAHKLMYMDEVGTPDSSRIWDGATYRQDGTVLENSKESFRQLLLNHFPDPDIFTNKNRMDERLALAHTTELPVEVLMQVSNIYVDMAEKITGKKMSIPTDPLAEIVEILKTDFDLIVS
eukprot:m.75542 g.75542  ORF g.75542 m.75542 type:complete len:372 (+) comp24798_c0_seq1:62-1177(+)